MRELFISVHVPKAGGSSWANALRRLAGDGFVPDYRHISGMRSFVPDIQELPTSDELMARITSLLEGDGPPVIVHGHFPTEKYSSVFPEATLLVWLRDPVDRVVSTYHHRVRSRKAKGMPPIAASLEDFAELPVSQNRQTHFVSDVPIESFDFVGILEERQRSLRLFESVTGLELPADDRVRNRNPDAEGGRYDLEPATRTRIERLNQQDVELYARGRDAFEALCRRFEVEG